VIFYGCFELFFDVPAEQQLSPRLGFVRFMMALEPFTVINTRAFIFTKRECFLSCSGSMSGQCVGISDSLLHFTEFRVNCKDYVAILVEIFQDTSKFKTFA